MDMEQPIVSGGKDAYEKNEARLKELGQKNTGDLSDDELETLLAERKQLKSSQTENLGNAQEEAIAENTERDAVAEQAARTKQSAEVAAQAAEQAAADADKAAELLAKIKSGDARVGAQATQLAEQITGGNVGVETHPIQSVETTQENPSKNIVEKIGAPKTEAFEQYGKKMRESAEALAGVMKEIRANDERMMDRNLDMPERLKAQEENKLLNDKRNQLLDDATFGANVMNLSSSYGGSLGTHAEMMERQYAKFAEYTQTAMSDPVTVMYLAEAGQLGNGYRENEGIGKVDKKLRSNPEYMMKMLETLPSRGAESFWVHCSGEARQNRDLYIASVQKNHLNYQFGSKEWKLDPEVQKIALESGLDSVYFQK